ncbi:MAG: hypothetical protein PVJ68_14200 [Candidatus Thiodiazotropha sp.]
MVGKASANPNSACGLAVLSQECEFHLVGKELPWPDPLLLGDLGQRKEELVSAPTCCRVHQHP